MKLLYIFILSLFLVSCGGNPLRCVNQGQLCDVYPEDYFKCEEYEHYNSDSYPGTSTLHISIWYRVKNTEDDEWTYWKTYSEMYDNYCYLEKFF